jgi:hypothetical protein
MNQHASKNSVPPSVGVDVSRIETKKSRVSAIELAELNFGLASANGSFCEMPVPSKYLSLYPQQQTSLGRALEIIVFLRHAQCFHC